MSYLSLLFGVGTPGASSTLDQLGGVFAPPAASGVSVTPETALKISTVWACTGLIAESVGMLPLLTYRYLADGGREVAKDHPLYQVLHSLPNAEQTAIEFREMMTGHVLLRGNAYALILPGRRGFADQLVPVHPDHVQPEILPNHRMRYRVTGEWAGTYLDEEMLHLRGRTNDGRTGLSVVSAAREAFGLALAAEGYGARYFGNNSQPSGVLKMPGKLKPEGARRLKAEWDEAHRGVNAAHRVAVLEEGLEWQQIGVTNKDSQFLELREFTAEDVCRWFRVPPHMVGLTSKSTSWGSGIEEMSAGFVTYTLQPWLTRWQQAIMRDLILAPQAYFVEFVVDALLRGRTLDRYNAYAIARNNGWLSVNEIRQRENLNPVDGGDGYLQPLNMTDLGEDPQHEAAPQDPAEDLADDSPAGAHYHQLLQEAAGRLARKETAALARAARRAGADAQAWAAAVDEFYAGHILLVAQAMCISTDMAARYVDMWSAQLKLRGPDTVQDSEPARIGDLVALTLEDLR